MSTRGLSPHKFSHSAMGTTFEVQIADPGADYAQQVSQAVFSEIDRLESQFSRFDPSSQLSLINRLLPGQTLSIGADLFDCLSTAFLLQDSTNGAFNINYRPSSSGSDKKKRPLKMEQSKRGFLVKRLDLNPESRGGGVDLDLGAIGKGYALDKALAILRDWDIENALIHGGTSTVLAIGDAPGPDFVHRGWPVGLGGHWPALRDYRRFLKSRALSGSGFEVKGAHIVNPRTGQRASGHTAAWVSHRSAAVADGLSTAFLVMESHEVAEYSKRNPALWALVLIDPDNYEVYNNGLEKNNI